MKYIRTLIARIGELVLKNISFKVEAAAIITAVYALNPEVTGRYGFTIVAVVWLVIVGFRYAEKVAGIIPRFTAGKGD